MCPFFNRDNSCCKLYDTYQDGYHKQTYCLGSGEWDWTKCANYEAAKKVYS